MTVIESPNRCPGGYRLSGEKLEWTRTIGYNVKRSHSSSATVTGWCLHKVRECPERVVFISNDWLMRKLLLPFRLRTVATQPMGRGRVRRTTEAISSGSNTRTRIGSTTSAVALRRPLPDIDNSPTISPF
jgi:hypothetical protein